jgi:hypothetical protein
VIARIVPGTEVRHEPNSVDPRSYRVDFSKIVRELGFRATTTMDGGVRQMAQAVIRGDIGSFEEAIYNNAAFLKASGSPLTESTSISRSRNRVRFAGPLERWLGQHSRLAAQAQ